MKRLIISSLVAALIAVSDVANAQDDRFELHQKILFIIAQTVGQICYTLEKGGEIGTSLSRSADAKLRNGLTRIADLDFRGAEQYRTERYHGVLHHELAATLKHSQDCKQAVFNKLIDKMMPNLASKPTSVIGGFDIVRDFYLSLGRADGITASSFVVPEKRTSGPFSASEITQFYSSLSEPLRLLELRSIEDNEYQATYTYRASPRHVCAGSAIVTVVERGGRPYIQKIKALQGC